MHFNFDFSASQILWTLTFAALLVLLVVLLGRDRARRFPWFTASIALMGLLLLTTQLLFSRLSRITGTEIFLVLSDLDVVVSLLVLVELARRAFRGAGRTSWVIVTLALVAVGAVGLALWGPWPAWKTLNATSQLAAIRLMDLVAEKGNLLASALAIELGLVVVLLGRRFKAGWRSHPQQIVIGLSTAALAQLGLRGTLQVIGTHTHIHTQAEYERIMDLRDKLIHANNVVYLCVLMWWIAWLWIDEPGAPAVAAAPAEAAPAAEGEASPPEAPAATEHSEPQSAGSDLRAFLLLL
jgi:hypothetical protein